MLKILKTLESRKLIKSVKSVEVRDPSTRTNSAWGRSRPSQSGPLPRASLT